MSFQYVRRSAVAAMTAMMLATTAQAQTPTAGGTLDPESPMAPLPDLGVEWPDLDKCGASSNSHIARWIIGCSFRFIWTFYFNL